VKLSYGKKNKIRNYKFGIVAEKIVILWLRLQCYEILAHRYQGYFGEIDIIAKRFKNLAFIEVKARNNIEDIEDILTNHQIRRIKKSAESFVLLNPRLKNLNYRYDLVAVNKYFRIRYFKNFFDW